MASPAHHADQNDQNPLSGRLPLRTTTTDPTVALISIGTMPPRKTSATPSPSRSSSARKPTLRSSRKAQTGARVFPARIASPERWKGPMVSITR